MPIKKSVEKYAETGHDGPPTGGWGNYKLPNAWWGVGWGERKILSLPGNNG